MKLLNFVRRCKDKISLERHETLHAADNSSTFCGKELNEMWFIESPASLNVAGLSPEHITCRKCRQVMSNSADTM